MATMQITRAGAAGALALLVAVGVVTGVVLNNSSPSSSKAAGNTGQTAGSASVQRRDLVETDTEAGTLSYKNPQTVYNRLSGTITAAKKSSPEARSTKSTANR